MFRKASLVLLGLTIGLSLASPSYADAPFELRSDGGRAGMQTFNVIGTAYAAYATPTDMLGICGSATRTVFVTTAYIAIGSTSGALQTITFIKRKTADTGGTLTLTNGSSAGAYDSLDRGLATASVVKFGAAPTLGTLDATLNVVQVTSSVLTAPYTIANVYQAPLGTADLVKFTRPIALRGVSDCLYLNYGGGALTSGFAANFGFVWVEGK